ncbi:MAG TPA: phosphate-starvation-inducible PsiE family protein [Methylomirabilota bacterium]|jgi:uncharacterized membrane protein (DUF373 family)|nr:phosphate-starvation-inducible PsiE family protein [Methylomirabilota bacterium]
MPDLRIAKTAAREDHALDAAESRVRAWVARGFTRVEDIVYVGLGILLAGTALVLLGAGVVDFSAALVGGTLPGHVVELLDRILLILMIVEILYTVQVSFREHALVPEPFLIVGLIAVTRRILVLTAEFGKFPQSGDVPLRNAMLELGLLSLMMLVLVASVVLLRRRGEPVMAEKA